MKLIEIHEAVLSDPEKKYDNYIIQEFSVGDFGLYKSIFYIIELDERDCTISQYRRLREINEYLRHGEKRAYKIFKVYEPTGLNPSIVLKMVVETNKAVYNVLALEKENNRLEYAIGDILNYDSSFDDYDRIEKESRKIGLEPAELFVLLSICESID